MDIEKRAHHLSERLNYIRDIFDGKHPEDIELLHNRLNEFFRRATEGIQSDPDAELTTLEELFTFMERKLETKIQPMDKVRIVRHPQRICLRDILENVYDNFTEIGGQEEHSIDPSMLIARATNHGLSASAAAIGALLARKYIYFVPFGQDDPLHKPTSLVADFTLVPAAAQAALEGYQLQPLLVTP